MPGFKIKISDYCYLEPDTAVTIHNINYFETDKYTIYPKEMLLYIKVYFKELGAFKIYKYDEMITCYG